MLMIGETVLTLVLAEPSELLSSSSSSSSSSGAAVAAAASAEERRLAATPTPVATSASAPWNLTLLGGAALVALSILTLA